jgi:hypothetical protein
LVYSLRAIKLNIILDACCKCFERIFCKPAAPGGSERISWKFQRLATQSWAETFFDISRKKNLCSHLCKLANNFVEKMGKDGAKKRKVDDDEEEEEEVEKEVSGEEEEEEEEKKSKSKKAKSKSEDDDDEEEEEKPKGKAPKLKHEGNEYWASLGAAGKNEKRITVSKFKHLSEYAPPVYYKELEPVFWHRGPAWPTSSSFPSRIPYATLGSY